MLELSFFKRPFVTLNEKPVDGFVSEKVVGLLAYLVLNEGTHSREAIASLLWAEMPDNRAKANLRQALYNLQKLLPAYFEISRKTVAFNRERPYQCDIEQFELAFQSNENEILEQALALYQDDLLPGLIAESELFDVWLREQRETLRLKRLDLLTHFVQIDLAQRDWKQASQRIRLVLSIEPWHEEMHRRLMWLYAKQRQYSAAIAQYQTCKTIMQNELGVKPMVETTAVFQRIEALRNRPLHNLPSQATSFFGRQSELSQMEETLIKPDCRCLSIIGPGGMGKTRLAITLAEKVQDNFLEGVIFCPLADLRPSDHLLSALIGQLTSVGLITASQTAQSAHQFLVDHLKDKELLLLLDNVEHLIEQLDPIFALLSECSGIKLLITSRERINSDWERPFFLSGFSNHETASEANDFFLQTAQQIQPDFKITAKNKEAVDTICRWVEGMPLGIELAVSWLRVFTVSQIAENVTGRLDKLKQKGRSNQRHRDLTAVLDQSWRLLTTAEQQILATLSVFRGSISLTAVEAVIEHDIEILFSLVDKSLLRVGPAQLETPRFECHELIRQFAETKLLLSAKQTEAAYRQHANYFAQWLTTIEPSLKNADQLATLKQIEVEMLNIKAGWQRCMTRGETAVFIDAARPLAFYFREKNLYREGYQFFNALPTTTLPNAVTACYLLHKSRFMFALKQTDQAVSLIKTIKPILEKSDHHWETALATRGLSLMSNNRAEVITGLNQSLALFEKAGDLYEVATELLNLSSWSYPKEAAVYLAKAVDIYESLGEKLEYSRALSFQGSLLGHHFGKFEQSKELIQDSLSIQEKMDTDWRLLNQITLGNVSGSLGQFKEAKRAYEEAAHILEKLYPEYEPPVHYSLHYRIMVNQSHLTPNLEDLKFQHLDDAQIEANSANELIDVGYYHLYKGFAYFQLNQFEAALAQCQLALSLFEEGHIWREMIEVHSLKGWILRQAEETSQAQRCFQQALEISIKHDTRPLFFEALVGYALTGVANDVETAVSLLKLATQSEATPYWAKQQAINALAQQNILYKMANHEIWGADVETAVAQILR
ncbi:MAG: BTAD domain-containing putative transcriptional regulator [Chloroflexota bacterium]